MMATTYPAHGWLPPGAHFDWQHADQGRDFVTDWQGVIQAPGDGVCIAVGSDRPFPGGFGPRYAMVRITSGAFAGHDWYIGHCTSLVEPGEHFGFGHALARADQGHNFAGTTGGWVELGNRQPNGTLGPNSPGGHWFDAILATPLVTGAPGQGPRAPLQNVLAFDTAASDYGPPPASAQAVMPYMDLRYRNIDAARARFPKLFVAGMFATITASNGDADYIDWEPGDLDPPPAAWYDQQHARGRWRPGFYADLSDMRAHVLPALQAHLGPLGPPGPGRPVRIWTAHPGTGQHICGPGTCGQLPIDADGTQYWWSSIQGPWPGAPGDLDVSLFRGDAFPNQSLSPEDIMGITMAPNVDGRLEIAVEHTDGSIWHTYQEYVPDTKNIKGWSGGKAGVRVAQLSKLCDAPGQ